MKQHLIDGCLDGGPHYGHFYALYQGKKLCDTLVVGTHDNEEMEKHKNVPLFDFDKRKFMLRYCKFVDILIEESLPYITKNEILDKYNCQMYLHGDEPVITRNDIDALNEIKKSNRYITYDVTNGISTTKLLYRIYCYHNNKKIITNLDYIYLQEIYDKISSDLEYLDYNSDNLLLIHSLWDFFNYNDIEYLLNIKKEYPNHKIVCVVDKDSDIKVIYNQLERAIVLCGISLINSILIEGKDKCDIVGDNIKHLLYTKDITHTLNNIISKFDLLENKLCKEIVKHSKFEKDKKMYLDNGLYFNTLKQQFDTIYEFVSNYTFNNKDIIIFDIDEVCLLNLMYTNDFYYSYLYNDFDLNEYNFKNGYNPKIKETNKLFGFIHDKSINYAFITGRKDRIRNLTIENLKKVSLDNYKFLYTCPDNFNGSMTTFKTSCRNEIVEKLNFNVVCCIGDQLSDITGDNVGVPFLIFNPFYKTF